MPFEEGLKQTVEWYRTHESWWRTIKSGEFKAYYQQQYATAVAKGNGVRIVITGAQGQLGTDLRQTLRGHQLTALDLPTFDLTASRLCAGHCGCGPGGRDSRRCVY